MKHPAESEILAFKENGLGFIRRRRVMKHLAGCWECRELLATAVSIESVDMEAAGEPDPEEVRRVLRFIERDEVGRS